MSKHPIAHIEFSSNDPKESGKFYADLFCWKIEENEEMKYVSFETETDRGGGFNDTSDENTNPGDILPYVGTDDIDASLARAEELGGKTLMPKMEIPTVGWFAVFSDPTGNKVGLYTSMES
ncbi:MAG: VOC family protein [Chloroflexi bacterium]|nr:VOC family protein [Chloroflexota bacterium]